MLLGYLSAAAAVVGAAACCLTPNRARARALAILMAVACLPLLQSSLALLGIAAALLIAMIALSVGSRRQADAERLLDAHRISGAFLMVVMLLLGGHPPGLKEPRTGGELGVLLHGGHSAASATALASGSIIALALGYTCWSLVLCARASHGSAPGSKKETLLSRLETGSMGAMFAAMSASGASNSRVGSGSASRSPAPS